MNPGKVLVAMSGGVDSAVCALLIRNAGYECEAAYLRLFDAEGERGGSNGIGSCDDAGDTSGDASGDADNYSTPRTASPSHTSDGCCDADNYGAPRTASPSRTSDGCYDADNYGAPHTASPSRTSDGCYDADYYGTPRTSSPSRTSGGSGDARAVSDMLGMPFGILDLRAPFMKNVIERFAGSYLDGGTPIPCVWCNKLIKFGELLDYADKRGFSHIATGHYARVEYDARSGRYLLKKGTDSAKDQSYMLYTLTQRQLGRVLFPLGALRKSDVWEIAASNGFPNAGKRESQDICFIPDSDYAGYIERHTGKPFEEGPLVDETGAIIGMHRGAARYTIGQRKGLGVVSASGPVYVYAKSAPENRVYVGPDALLYSKTLIAGDINLIPFDSLPCPMRVTAKTRYSQSEQPAVIEQISNSEIKAVFDEPQRAITSGQSVVFYDGDAVVGGGIIV